MKMSGLTASELREHIARSEAMRDLYIGGSAYYFRQYDELSSWLREQLCELEASS